MNALIVLSLTLVAVTGTVVVTSTEPTRQAVTLSFFGLTLTAAFAALSAPDVVGAAVLLRPSEEEARGRPPAAGRVLEITQLAGYLLLPVTLIVGFDVVAHGHLTPGGGFQGGVVLATGLHLVYVTGSYRALDRLRPLALYDAGDAVGAALFAAIGLAAIVVAGDFLANIVPQGTFGQLLSAGTVPLLSIAVGVEVSCGMVVLLAHFLNQEIAVYARRRRGAAT